MGLKRTVSSKSIPRIAILGEVLWDCFPDQRVLGGAPFNVAWNLAGFGCDPLMISAVGTDPLGEEILSRMRDWNMSTDFIHVDPERPTGSVQVKLNDGEPSYTIVEGVAYDAIPEPTTIPTTIEILYHGSLAWRSESNRTWMHRLRQQSSLKTFVDVNIRQPHFDAAWVPNMLQNAFAIKLNADELGIVAGFEVKDSKSRESAARYLLDQYAAKQIYVTRGASGAEWYSHDGGFESIAAPQPRTFVDAVGAGDAFASVVLHGLLSERNPRDAMRDAVEFAADVCGLSGATTHVRDFYHRAFIT